MNIVEQTCPLPGGTPPTGDECNTTKTATWSSPGTINVNFFIQTNDDTVVRFQFTPISNNGSTIIVNVIYGDNGVREVKSTYNLGLLPTTVSKYHLLDLGAGFRTNQVVTFQVTTIGGTSGSFEIFFDCDVPICFSDFCYSPPTNPPSDLCWECPTIRRLYWECPGIKQFFPVGELFTDPELSIEAPVGFYRVINDSLPPVIYYYDGNKFVKQDACGVIIDCNDSAVLEHRKGDYKYATAKISGVPEKEVLITQVGVNRRGDRIVEQRSVKNINYSIKDVIVWFPTTNPGYTTIDFTVAGGSYEDVCFTVSDVNAPFGQVGYLSYSIVGVPAFEAYNPPFSPDTLIRLELNSNTIRVKIFFNGGNQLTQGLRIRAAVGQKKRYKKNDVIQTTISASCTTDIYSYQMGVHPYSAYDAVSATSKNTTIIYSLNPIDQWVEESTILYHDPLLSFPAFPWFYGYENKVYQVQSLYLREVGSKRTYQVKSSMAGRFWRWITFQGNRINLQQFDGEVKNWLADGRGGDYSQVCPTCLWTEMEWGRLKRIFDETDQLQQPTGYFYFLGYEPNAKFNSMGRYFTATQIPTGNSYPIGGLQHLMFRNRINNYSLNRTIPGPDWFYYPFSSWAADVGTGGWIVANTVIIVLYFKALIAASASATAGAVFVGGSSALTFCPEPVTCAVILLAIITVLLIIEFFKIHRVTIEERCDPPFLIAYNSGPYIEQGSTIYYNKYFSVVKDGFYSDGAYFYTQSGGIITAKEQGEFYDTQVGSAPGTWQKVPLPDVPNLIQAIPSLYFLCYIAGRPTYDYTYYSPVISTSISKPQYTGDLMESSEGAYSLPAGTFGSNISQLDADNQAYEYFNGLTAGTVFQTSIQKPGVQTIFLDFTHQIKIENFPSSIELFYDNSNSSGLTVNKKLYYDDEGFFSVLTGFYSKNADDNINYKNFYEVSAGTIVDVWVMSSSTATTVTSQETSQVENIVQTYLNYTSSWYFTSQRYEWLGQNISSTGVLFDSGDTWNSLNFYNNSAVVRGFIDTPTTYDNFYLFNDNFTTTGFTEAPEGYYTEVPIINNFDTFSYLTGQTLTLEIVQECSEMPELNGIRVNCIDEDGELTPATDGVQFTLIIYLNSGSTQENNFYSYDLKIESNEFENFQFLDVSLIGQIAFAEISTISSTNPVGKTTYTGGTFTACATPTPTPTNVIWTLTPTPSQTQTPTNTSTPTPTPTITPTIGTTECDEYYNNTASPLNGINYTDCEGIAYPSITVNPGEGICVIQGTLNGGDSGFLTNLGYCGTYNPNVTPTPTQTLTKTQTRTPVATPTSIPTINSILLSTPQNDGCVSCALTTYSVTAYTESLSNEPVVGEIIYSDNTGSTLFNGANQWYKTDWGSPLVSYSIRISSIGVISELKNCGSCTTPVPSASVTPSQSQTPPVTPSTTPSQTETPTTTPTNTPTPTNDAYFYYNTDTYSCSACGNPSTGTAILRFSTEQVSTWFSDGFTAYSRTGPTSGPSYDVDGDILAFGSSCVIACTA